MDQADSPLEEGLRALATELGPGFARTRVARVDPHRAGHLLFQVERNGRREWYGCLESGVAPLHLAEDEILPASAHLAGLLADGHARLIAWQPGRRATVCTRNGAGQRILKAYRKRRSADAVHRHQVAAKAVLGAGLTVPSLLHHDPEGEVIHLEFVEGSRPSLGTDAIDIFSALGSELRLFQQAGVDGSLPVHGRDEELGVLSRFATRSRQLRNGLPAGWESLFEVLRGHVARAPTDRLMLAHRDLHDGQLLVGKGRIALLDFDLLCLAEPALDAANLSAHLLLRSLQGLYGATPQSVDAMGRALLDGLGRVGENGFVESLLFYRASTFLRLALVYYLRPRWESITPALVSVADRLVHEIAPA